MCTVAWAVISLRVVQIAYAQERRACERCACVLHVACTSDASARVKHESHTRAPREFTHQASCVDAARTHTHMYDYRLNARAVNFEMQFGKQAADGRKDRASIATTTPNLGAIRATTHVRVCATLAYVANQRVAGCVCCLMSEAYGCTRRSHVHHPVNMTSHTHTQCRALRVRVFVSGQMSCTDLCN